MDKSLDEIIGNSRPAPQRKANAPKGVSKGRSSRGNRNKSARSASGPSPRGFKTVFIRNLSDSISEDDLRDLFRQVGPVVRVNLERDDRGDRTGLAWVLYDFAEDAIVAAERYNQRKAAGQTITVRRVEHVGDTGVRAGGSLGERIGNSIGGSDGGRGSQKKRRNRGDKPKNNRQPPRTRNTADLDAELDAYMQVDAGLNAQSSNQVAAAPAAPAPQPQVAAEESMIDV